MRARERERRDESRARERYMYRMYWRLGEGTGAQRAGAPARAASSRSRAIAVRTACAGWRSEQLYMSDGSMRTAACNLFHAYFLLRVLQLTCTRNFCDAPLCRRNSVLTYASPISRCAAGSCRATKGRAIKESAYLAFQLTPGKKNCQLDGNGSTSVIALAKVWDTPSDVTEESPGTETARQE